MKNRIPELVVSGITTLDEARRAVQLGADVIGLNVHFGSGEPPPRHLCSDAATELTRSWVRGPELEWRFHESDNEAIMSAMDLVCGAGPRVITLGGAWHVGHDIREIADASRAGYVELAVTDFSDAECALINAVARAIRK